MPIVLGILYICAHAPPVPVLTCPSRSRPGRSFGTRQTSHDPLGVDKVAASETKHDVGLLASRSINTLIENLILQLSSLRSTALTISMSLKD